MHTTTTETVLAAYIAAALFTESIGEEFAADWNARTGDDIAPDVSLESFGFTADDIAPESIDSMRDDIVAFLDNEPATAAAVDGGFWDEEQIGHDFWLTRNRHGAGFWARFMSDPGERLGRELTTAAHAFGESSLYVGDDGRVHVG